MAKERILLLGAGGHGKSVIEAIESEGRFEIAGILDSPDKVGQTLLGYPVLGTDADLHAFITSIPNVIIAVGQLKSAAKRKQLFQLAKDAGAILPVIVASTAYVSKHATLAEGTVVLHQAFVNAAARIGKNSIINTSAIVEHDATIGDHCHISTKAVINGECSLGHEVFIGSGAILKNGIFIQDKVVIGAGAVVLKTGKTNSVLVGNPAKEI
ncbi:acetyltransferase [Adhaeribacter swui]|uniref:Acetyltransferase n=1 Tax=Adhaeribacter swui TaxID=2086471 RepID=A0A7G7G9H1_9BACT|nr:acetyltransferase [Adhaeribacter swui]QNF33805.1 acetyltransferase [Adhaeribacter swui]